MDAATHRTARRSPRLLALALVTSLLAATAGAQEDEGSVLDVPVLGAPAGLEEDLAAVAQPYVERYLADRRAVHVDDAAYELVLLLRERGYAGAEVTYEVEGGAAQLRGAEIETTRHRLFRTMPEWHPAGYWKEVEVEVEGEV